MPWVCCFGENGRFGLWSQCLYLILFVIFNAYKTTDTQCWCSYVPTLYQHYNVVSMLRQHYINIIMLFNVVTTLYQHHNVAFNVTLSQHHQPARVPVYNRMRNLDLYQISVYNFIAGPKSKSGKEKQQFSGIILLLVTFFYTFIPGSAFILHLYSKVSVPSDQSSLHAPPNTTAGHTNYWTQPFGQQTRLKNMH